MAESWWKKESYTKEEIFDVSPFFLNMIVVKVRSGHVVRVSCFTL